MSVWDDEKALEMNKDGLYTKMHLMLLNCVLNSGWFMLIYGKNYHNIVK